MHPVYIALALAIGYFVSPWLALGLVMLDLLAARS
jgi:hypothetical protein